MFRTVERPTPPPRLVLLDVDGTLIDSRSAIVAAYREALAAVDLVLDESAEAVSRLLAERVEEACARLAGDRADEAARGYRAAYPAASRQHVRALAGARELLDGLAARAIPIGVVTNKGRDRLLPDLEQAGLGAPAAVLAVAVTAEDSHERKPHPRPIEIALERAACAAADAIYVGDGPHDLQAARAAGVTAVAAAYGYYPAALLEREQPDLVLRRPQELLDAIDVRGAAEGSRA